MVGIVPFKLNFVGMNNKQPNSFMENPLQTIAMVMDLLLNEEDLMVSVEQSLMWIGKFSNQHRAYLFEIHTDPKTKRVLASQRCEWVSEGISPEIHNPVLINVDLLKVFPRWHDSFFQGKEISGPVREFPPAEQDVLLPQKIKSLLAVPVFEKKLLRGFIGFDNCEIEYEWDNEEKALLRTVASAIGAAMGRQKHLEQLVESEERFRNLFQNVSTIAVRGYSRSGTIHYWNNACESLYGYSTEEACGQNIYDLIVPESQRGHLESLLNQLETCDRVPAEEFILHNRSGNTLSVLSNTARMVHAGRPDEFFNFDVDLTGYKKLENQFLRSQRMEAIGSLASGIAHDLNNVLSPLMMSLDLLRQEVGTEQESLLRIMEKSIHRASEMVMQILSYERGLEGKCEVVNINHVFSELTQLLKDTLPKNVAWIIEKKEDLPFVMGDATQLQQVLLNLVINARDAMPEGGIIRLIASGCFLKVPPPNMLGNTLPSGTYLKLVMEDCGEGMTEDVLMKVFEPFFSTKAEGKGTGLGLSTSLAILKSHHAAVQVKSKVGKGSVFTIYLPEAAPVDEVETSSAETLQRIPAGNARKILIVDDEQHIRDTAKHVLQGAGYIVLEADNGQTAIKMIQDHPDSIQLVLMDIMMPIMDGKTAIEHIRSIQPHLPVLATSGLQLESLLETGTSEAVTEFISKPFKSHELLIMIDAMLTRFG